MPIKFCESQSGVVSCSYPLYDLVPPFHYIYSHKSYAEYQFFPKCAGFTYFQNISIVNLCPCTGHISYLYLM